MHFGLFAKGRRAQPRALVEYVLNEIPHDAPLMIAGDFNDWRNQLSHTLANELGVHDVFDLASSGKPARSFPSRFPLFRWTAFMCAVSTCCTATYISAEMARLSDHAALSAQLESE